MYKIQAYESMIFRISPPRCIDFSEEFVAILEKLGQAYIKLGEFTETVMDGVIIYIHFKSDTR